jgi:hypothetical protein
VRFIALGTKHGLGLCLTLPILLPHAKQLLQLQSLSVLKQCFGSCAIEGSCGQRPHIWQHRSAVNLSISCTFRRLSILLTSTQLDSVCLHDALLPFLEGWTILTAYKWEPV